MSIKPSSLVLISLTRLLHLYSSIEMSAPSLTEEQQRAEEAWLDEFNQAADSLDWAKWEKFWDSGNYNPTVREL